MRSLRHPATIIASLTLLASLVGTRYASGLINGRQIKNGTITGSKLANNTIPGSKLQNNTIPLQKLSPPVAYGLHYILHELTGPAQAVAPGPGTVSFACPLPGVALGGGFAISGPGGASQVYVQGEFPDDASHSWVVQVDNTSPSTVFVTGQRSMRNLGRDARFREASPGYRRFRECGERGLG